LRLSGARGGLRRSRLSCPGSTGQSCAKAPVRPRMPDRRLERDTGPPACRGASGASRRCQRAALMSGRAVRALWAKGCLWARMPSLRAARRTVGIPRRKAYNNVRWAWMGNALFAFARRSASPRGFVSLRRGEHRTAEFDMSIIRAGAGPGSGEVSSGRRAFAAERKKNAGNNEEKCSKRLSKPKSNTTSMWRHWRL
jgi:hypothetical protein